MPEAPECRRTADWLKSHVGGHIVRTFDVAGRFVKQPIERLQELKNARCVAVRCKGKVIVLDFDNDVSAISTLGMSGRWTHDEDKHAALRIGCELPPTRGILPVYYVDQRRFGNFKVVDTRAATTRLDELGWDALAEPGGWGKVRGRALKYMRHATPVCEVMLDQQVFAGCGNYLRAEAMLLAKVNPWMPWKDLKDESELCVALAKICRDSYSRGGATLETFYDGDGNRGDHVDFLTVYGRSHDPHGNQVERRKDKNGRTVWWVPSVQK